MAPFPKRYDSARGYYAVLARHAGRARRRRGFRIVARRTSRARARPTQAPESPAPRRAATRSGALPPPAADDMPGELPAFARVALRAFGLGRALRAARRGARACSISRAGTAAMRAYLPREARTSSPSTATRRRSGLAESRASRPRRRSRIRRVAVRGERFDAIVVANYLHRLVPGALARARRRRRPALRDVRPRQRGLWPADQSGFPAGAGTSSCAGAGPLTVIAFEQGCSLRGSTAVVQRLAAAGRGRPWPPPSWRGDRAARSPSLPERNNSGLRRSNGVKSTLLTVFFHTSFSC